MFETSLDFQFRLYAVILTAGLAVFFAFRYPAANCLLGFSALGLGGEIIYGTFTFGQLAAVLQALTVVSCLVEAFRLGRTRTIGLLLRTGTPFYAVMLLLLWLKILYDCFLFGFDDYRIGALKMGVYQTLLPSAIGFLSLAVRGTMQTRNALILGLVALPCAYVLPLVYPMIVEERLTGAITGASRLTTYAQDTINGGRMIYFGCIGFLCAGVAIRHVVVLRSLSLGFALVFFVLALLNGTRQFLLAVVLCFVGTLFLLGRSREVIGVALLIGVGIGVYGLGELFTEASVSERVGAESLRIEVTSSRGAIWSEAFATARQFPVLGVGFRNYGEEVEHLSLESGEIVLARDSAHGFLQDVTVEHGFFLSGGLFASWLWLTGRCWRARVLQTNRLLLLLLVVLVVPEFFSGASFNAFGFHLVALTSFVLALDRAGDELEGGISASDSEPRADVEVALSSGG